MRLWRVQDGLRDDGHWHTKVCIRAGRVTHGVIGSSSDNDAEVGTHHGSLGVLVQKGSVHLRRRLLRQKGVANRLHEPTRCLRIDEDVDKHRLNALQVSVLAGVEDVHHLAHRHPARISHDILPTPPPLARCETVRVG